MQSIDTARTSAATAPVAEHAMALTRWEQAEAEAEADLLDADLESCGPRELRTAVAAPRRILPRPTGITEDDLAEAECEADLCHVDDAA